MKRHALSFIILPMWFACKAETTSRETNAFPVQQEIAKPQPEQAQSCITPLLESEQNSPSEWFAAHTKPGQILLVAEHHEQTSQINSLTTALSLTAKSSADVYFAAEWLPASATEKVNKLVQAETWNDQLWWSIISDKYFIRPLHVEEYRLPLQNILQLNQNRTSPIKLLGLAPDCRMLDKTIDETTECLLQREQFMEDQIRKNFPPNSPATLVVSLGFRHAQLITTDVDNHIPLGKRLTKDYSVTSLLLNGLGQHGRTLCAGIFDSFTTEAILSLTDPSLRGLTSRCLNTDPYHEVVLLSEIFSHVWTGFTTREQTLLSETALQNMPPSALEGWSNFQSRLMGAQNVQADPKSWTNWIQNEWKPIKMAPLTEFDCAQLPLFLEQ